MAAALYPVRSIAVYLDAFFKVIPMPITRSPLRSIRFVQLLLLVALVGFAFSLPAAAAQTPTPKMVLAETVIDLGEVPRGSTPTARFTIENRGDATLSFPRHSKSCACAEVTATDIPPKQSGLVTIDIDTLKLSGPSSAQVTLLTNDPVTGSVVLTVKVFSRDILVAEPGYFRYLVHQNFNGDSTIRQQIGAVDGKDFEIVSIESPVAGLTVGEARPAEDGERMARIEGSQWVFEASLDNQAPVGPLTGNVLVRTTHPDQKTILVPVSGFVRPVFAFTPSTLDMGTFSPKPGAFWIIHVKQFGAEPVDIESVTTETEGLALELKELTPGREWDIRVTATDELAKGPFSATVNVSSNSPYLPETSVRIQGQVN